MSGKHSTEGWECQTVAVWLSRPGEIPVRFGQHRFRVRPDGSTIQRSEEVVSQSKST